jgi:isoleucyl-tRNA synthetase
MNSINQGTYKDVKDTSCVAMFHLPLHINVSHPLYEQISAASTTDSDKEPTGKVYVLAWTTTPWTLPSNLGLTVGPSIEYVLVKTFNPYTV